MRQLGIAGSRLPLRRLRLDLASTMAFARQRTSRLLHNHTRLCECKACHAMTGWLARQDIQSLFLFSWLFLVLSITNNIHIVPTKRGRTDTHHNVPIRPPRLIKTDTEAPAVLGWAREMIFLQVNHSLAGWRDDPRYIDLIRAIGFSSLQ